MTIVHVEDSLPLIAGLDKDIIKAPEHIQLSLVKYQAFYSFVMSLEINDNRYLFLMVSALRFQ